MLTSAQWFKRCILMIPISFRYVTIIAGDWRHRCFSVVVRAHSRNSRKAISFFFVFSYKLRRKVCSHHSWCPNHLKTSIALHCIAKIPAFSFMDWECWLTHLIFFLIFFVKTFGSLVFKMPIRNISSVIPNVAKNTLPYQNTTAL